jgi:hypothetical protein
MAKIYIRVGHGNRDFGAEYKGQKESEDNLRMAMAVKPLLESAGHAVKLSRTSQGDTKKDAPSISAIVKKSNAWGANYFIDIHRNSGGGTGNECLIRSTSSTKSRNLAQAILTRVCAVYGKNRGVKVRDKNTGSLAGNNAPGTIIELLFIDNAADNSNYDSKFNDYARAIAQGVCDLAGGKIGGGAMAGSWQKDKKGYWYKYADGSYPKNKWAQLPYSNANSRLEWFYFDKNGYLVTSAYIYDKKGYCWVGKDGKWNGKYYQEGFKKGDLVIKNGKAAFIESVHPIVK